MVGVYLLAEGAMKLAMQEHPTIGGFPLFGQVKKGFATLDKINAGASDNTNAPNVRYSVISIDVQEHAQ